MSAPSPPAAHAALELLTVRQGIHFRDLRLDLHDLLNFLIGGRGAGKSGVLHLIRFALGAPIPAAYAEEVDDYLRGTLGEGTAMVGVRTRHGARYTSSRRVGEAPVVRDEQGNEVTVPLLGELFSLEAYAQNEIEGIGKKPQAQLDLIDRFLAPDVRRIDAEVAQLERRITDVAAQRRRLAAEIEDDAGREGELAVVVEALKGVNFGGGASSTDVARVERERAHDAKILRGREHAAMTALGAELESVRAALESFTRDALQKLARAIEGDLERAPHGEAFRRAHAAMQRASGALEGSSGRLRSELGATERALAEEGRLLATAHAKEEEEYRTVVVRDEADRARVAEGERLHARFIELSGIAKRLGDRRREEGAAREAEAALLAEHERLFAEKSALRARVCEDWTRALGDEVRAKITPQADSARWSALLTDVLRGANLRPAELIETIAARIRPRDLVAMVEDGEIGPLVALDTVQKGRDARAEKILRHLRESGRLHEIAMMRLDDVPRIELKVGTRWRVSSKLSPGQRCSCILSILLLLSDSPLLIDQVEDNIDNPFIYRVLVERLDQTKAHRQLVVATLNPNPPALADADRIFALDVDEEGNGLLAAAGRFEEVKAHVERLEGGREAFRKRARRYGFQMKEDGGAQ